MSNVAREKRKEHSALGSHWRWDVVGLCHPTSFQPRAVFKKKKKCEARLDFSEDELLKNLVKMKKEN